MSLPGYDQWLEAPYNRDDLWECGQCEKENNGGDECHECEADRPSNTEPACRNGRCGDCPRCDRAVDEAMDR